MTVPSGTLTLKDGRVLTWDEHGDPDGPPILYFHGTPASRVMGTMVSEPAAEAKVRLIVPDRPGCGLSSFQPDRRMTDWPDDVAQLADHLGLERYAVVGGSGGGPYALACAHAADPRLVATAVLAGVGPLDTPEARGRLYDTNRGLFETAAQGVDALLPLLQGLLSADSSSDEVRAAFMAGMSPDDQRYFAEHPTFIDDFAEMAIAAAENGLEGLAHDTWLVTQPWGFELADITVRVDFYNGDHDYNVPVQHAVDQAAATPLSTLTVFPASGHTVVGSRLADVLDQLAEVGELR
jgi:pimeloyl-ACP methyl ester carboxylesterase